MASQYVPAGYLLFNRVIARFMSGGHLITNSAFPFPPELMSQLDRLVTDGKATWGALAQPDAIKNVVGGKTCWALLPVASAPATKIASEYSAGQDPLKTLRLIDKFSEHLAEARRLIRHLLSSGLLRAYRYEADGQIVEVPAHIWNTDKFFETCQNNQLANAEGKLTRVLIRSEDLGVARKALDDSDPDIPWDHDPRYGAPNAKHLDTDPKFDLKQLPEYLRFLVSIVLESPELVNAPNKKMVEDFILENWPGSLPSKPKVITTEIRYMATFVRRAALKNKGGKKSKKGAHK